MLLTFNLNFRFLFYAISKSAVDAPHLISKMHARTPVSCFKTDVRAMNENTKLLDISC